MTGAILPCDDCILSLQEYITVFIHQDCAEWMVTMLARGLCKLDRCAQMSYVCIVHRSFPVVTFI